MSLGSAPRVLSLSSGVVTRCKVSPFLTGADVLLEPAAAAAATVYRVFHPGTGSATKYAAFRGDGSTTVFAMPAGLNALDNTVDASITDANRLRVIALINGSPIVRKGSDASPSAGQFCANDTTHVTFGSTYASGTKIEILAMDAADITNTGSIAAGVVKEETCQSFYTASAACALVVSGRY